MARDTQELDTFPNSGGAAAVYLPDGSREVLDRCATDHMRNTFRSGQELDLPGNNLLHGRRVRRMNWTCCGEAETVAIFVA